MLRFDDAIMIVVWILVNLSSDHMFGPLDRWTVGPLDVGPHTLDVGRSAVGCWTLEVGRCTLGVGRWALDV